MSIDHESADVLSLTMQTPDGHQLLTALPGQYVVLRLQPSADFDHARRSRNTQEEIEADMLFSVLSSRTPIVNLQDHA
jgi:hypothetical protein